MKKLLFLLLLSVSFITVNAQTSTNSTSSKYSVVKSSKKTFFDVDSGTPTGEQWVVGPLSYDIFVTKSGSEYVKAVNKKTGNRFPKWIGQLNGDTYDGLPVRVTKSGQPHVWRFVNGKPKKETLQLNK